MHHNLINFILSEDGAITVDWVVLTAMVVGLATVIGVTVSGAALEPNEGIAAFIDDQEVATY